MALEAINNAMGVQATSYAAPVKTQAVNNERVEVVPENINESAKIDASTKIIENADSKADSNYDGAPQSAFQQQATTNNEQLKKAIENFNSSSGNNSEAVYGIHEGTNRVTIKIVDKNTKKVIKELPPEKTLDMIARVWEMAGILIDEKR